MENTCVVDQHLHLHGDFHARRTALCVKLKLVQSHKKSAERKWYAWKSSDPCRNKLCVWLVIDNRTKEVAFSTVCSLLYLVFLSILLLMFAHNFFVAYIFLKFSYFKTTKHEHTKDNKL